MSGNGSVVPMATSLHLVEALNPVPDQVNQDDQADDDGHQGEHFVPLLDGAPSGGPGKNDLDSRGRHPPQDNPLIDGQLVVGELEIGDLTDRGGGIGRVVEDLDAVGQWGIGALGDLAVHHT